MLQEPYPNGGSSSLYFDENGTGQCEGNPRMSVVSHTDNHDGSYTYTIRVMRWRAGGGVAFDPPRGGVSSAQILQYVPTPGPGNDL